MKVGLSMRIPFQIKLFLSLLLMMFCTSLWSAQQAVVIADQAVIYADEQMSSPIGFVARGKKIKVGEIARNKAQVYPIIVSAKMAFIRARDIDTRKEALDGSLLVAERFQKHAKADEKVGAGVGVAVFNYTSQAQIKSSEGSSTESLEWSGFSLKGFGIGNNKWVLEVIGNYMMSKKIEDAQFRSLEVGLGAGYRFLDYGRLVLRVESQLLAVPWSNYSQDTAFRVNGRGLTAGAGVGMTVRLTKHWDLDGYGGFYHTRLGGFDVPEPFSSPELTINGTRLGLGINYVF
jgi:hypothetical protein